MFTHLTDRAKAFLFYGLAFGLTLSVSVLAPPLLGDTTVLVHMFTPLVAVALMLVVVTRDGYSRAGWLGLGVHRAGFRGWGLALLGPPLVLLFAYGIVWSAGVAAFAVPAGTSSLLVLLISQLLNIVIGIVIGGILAFGEEIGYRGYLLPRLLFLGPTRALLLSGLLHGLWHLPVILFTPYYHGAGNLLITLPLFLATLTAAGVIYGYLRLTTGSVWPAVLLHSTWNAVWALLAYLTVASSPLATEYLAGESGILTLLATAVVAGWFLSRLQGRLVAPQLNPVPSI
jgi:membrane protease YdiL (CAAX protease family)